MAKWSIGTRTERCRRSPRPLVAGALCITKFAKLLTNEKPPLPFFVVETKCARIMRERGVAIDIDYRNRLPPITIPHRATRHSLCRCMKIVALKNAIAALTKNGARAIEVLSFVAGLGVPSPQPSSAA